MIAIVNGKVMTITQGTLEPGTVLVEGGRIVAVGNDQDLRGGIRCGSILIDEMRIAGA